LSTKEIFKSRKQNSFWEKYQLKKQKLLIRRTLLPDIYVHSYDRTGKSFYFSKEGQWLLNSPNLQPDYFKAFTDLIDLYEGAEDNQ
jgi:hypothetical protein